MCSSCFPVDSFSSICHRCCFFFHSFIFVWCESETKTTHHNSAKNIACRIKLNSNFTLLSESFRFVFFRQRIFSDKVLASLLFHLEKCFSFSSFTFKWNKLKISFHFDERGGERRRRIHLPSITVHVAHEAEDR